MPRNAWSAVMITSFSKYEMKLTLSYQFEQFVPLISLMINKDQDAAPFCGIHEKKGKGFFVSSLSESKIICYLYVTRLGSVTVII